MVTAGVVDSSVEVRVFDGARQLAFLAKSSGLITPVSNPCPGKNQLGYLSTPAF